MPVLSEFIIDTQPKLHQLVRSLDVLIRKAAPDLVASLKWGNLTYHLGRNVCAIIAHDGYVNLQIWDGTSIDDPHGLLDGNWQDDASYQGRTGPAAQPPCGRGDCARRG